ncbi:hypothetical protein WMF28_22630 [Sorangium sp. So ce590]|uniref:hypothetical protein n=1 Tax=Sorangium sp. So ce590 TaxID=3133317 RepID=UPI003F5FB1CB
MQKKRKVLRAPFIVTVAAAASLAGAVALPGCDPTVQGGSCPEEMPERGSSCDADDLSCDYIDSCDNPIDFRCVDGAWQVEDEMSCNPPPPACPEEMPANGAPCDGGIGTCGYEMITGCGPMPIDAACVLEDDTWRWQVHEIFCNPPPPDQCLTAATANECAGLGPTCQWLVPGCAEGSGTPALPAVGCFPSLPCEADEACPSGTLCQEVVVNPCVASSPDGATCAACGATEHVCVPPSAATTASK